MDRYNIFSSLILNINRHIQKIKSFEMKKLGLKGNQVQCLYHLYGKDCGVTPTQLCKLCQEDKGAISRTVKELENGEYLYVDEQNNKKYRNPIKLTEKGVKAAKIIFDTINKILKIVSKDIKNEEREIFYKNLTLVSNNLNKICENLENNWKAIV